jgi:hypothetical protein
MPSGIVVRPTSRGMGARGGEVGGDESMAIMPMCHSHLPSVASPLEVVVYSRLYSFKGIFAFVNSKSSYS